MRLSITYAELQEYVASHYHKKVELGYVNESTVSVSVPVKVLGFTKQISINRRSLCHTKYSLSLYYEHY